MDWNSAEIVALVRRALAEDVGGGDATALATVPALAKSKAHIVARAETVVAGLPLAKEVFLELDSAVHMEYLVRDGDVAPKDAVLATIGGPARAILTGERTALNFLAHLSGIATLTHRFVERLAGTKARIRDTRKTTPGLRLLEKYAVRMGGGTNHRVGLYDAILLKENHIALAGGVKQALDQAHAYASLHTPSEEVTAYEAAGHAPESNVPNSLAVQIEVRDERELREALDAGAQAVLLDNMTPEQAEHSVEVVRSVRPDCVVEISGGITLDNARAYALTGADFLSSGALTHSAPAANLSLLVDRIQEKVS
jgi:nicotinate-nucleotide pyrophosphorylase (carboxylating)